MTPEPAVEGDTLTVIYVGEFSELDVTFRKIKGRSFHFRRDVPTAVPAELRPHFEGHGQFIIGDKAYNAEGGDRPTTVLVRRLGALGDVLAVHGAVVGIHRAFPGKYRFVLQTSPMYVEVMRRQPEYVEVIDHVSPINLRREINKYFNLDGWYELDHQKNGPKDSRVNRTWYRLLNRRVEALPALKADFPFVVPETARAAVWKKLDELKIAPETRKFPLVGVSLTARSTTARTPSPELARAVCEALVDRGMAVFFVEQEAPGWSIGKGGFFHFPTGIAEAVALYRNLDVVVTPDSGSMWLAHCAPVPMVFWGGSTPGTVKCCHHPYWPHGVRLVQTNDWIDCPSCFEFAEACGYKYTCLKNPDPERFVRETVGGVVDLVGMKQRGVFKTTAV